MAALRKAIGTHDATR